VVEEINGFAGFTHVSAIKDHKPVPPQAGSLCYLEIISFSPPGCEWDIPLNIVIPSAAQKARRAESKLAGGVSHRMA
jgi:hypothetical protein